MCISPLNTYTIMHTAVSSRTIAQKLSLEKQCVFLKGAFTDPSFVTLVGVLRSALKHQSAGNLSRAANDIGKCTSALSYFFNDAAWNVREVRSLLRLRLMHHRHTRIEVGDIAAIDESSISKNGDTFECIGKVWDNADKAIHDGYALMTVAIVSATKGTRWIFDEILYSNVDPAFRSMPIVVLRLLRRLFAHTTITTVVFDRGFRNAYIVKYVVEKGKNFVLRATEDMLLIHDTAKKGCPFGQIKRVKNARHEALVVNGTKGWSMTWATGAVNAWMRVIRVPFTVVSIYRPSFHRPMILVTNLPINNADDALALYQTYLNRWKIEILFQEIKALGLETFRVRKKRAIVKYLTVVIVLHTLLTLQLAWVRKAQRFAISLAALLLRKRKIPDLHFGGIKICHELLLNRVITVRDLCVAVT